MKFTNDIFICKSKEIHGDTYDYSLVNYINNHTKIKIICKKHGVFYQQPRHHLLGGGCKKCFVPYNKLTIDDFIKYSNIAHNYKYDYSLVKYKNSHIKVKILCPIHGVFEQKPYEHKQKRGCPKCAGNIKKTQNEFIIELEEKFPNIIILGNYKSRKTKILVDSNECKHEPWLVTPTNLLNGCGCPVCNESKGEKIIRLFLTKNNINFRMQKIFNNCCNIKPLPFDFYLPDYNICIEYDGEQHFKIKENWGGKDGFIKIKNNDKIKDSYCDKNNIKLIRILKVYKS
jgi:hypothetical protein